MLSTTDIQNTPNQTKNVQITIIKFKKVKKS